MTTIPNIEKTRGKQMVIMHVLHSVLFLLLCASPLCGQAQSVVDDMTSEYLKTQPKTSERFALAGRYAQSLFFNNRQDEAFSVLKENTRHAMENNNHEYAAYLSAVTAIQYRILDDRENSNHYLDQAKHYADRTSDYEANGYVFYAEGWLLLRDDKESEAVSYLQKAVDQYKSAPEDEQILGRLNGIYKELASIYLNWREFDLYNKYVNLTLQTAQKQKDTMRLFDGYALMGYMYEQLFHENLFQTEYRDQAENYYQGAIKIYEDNKDKMMVPSDLAYAAVNLSNLYLASYPDEYYDKALEYAQLGLDVAIETQQYNLVASSYGIMSDLALKQGDTEGAKNNLMAALAAIGNESMVDNTTTMNIFLNLSQIHEQEGDLAESIHYYKQYINAFESVFNSEKVEQSKRLEAQFDKERQDQKMIRMQLEADKQGQQISLMHALSMQQEQELQNLKLQEENQKQQLAVVQLEAERRNQELQLSRLEAKQRDQALFNSQKELNYKSRLNTVYSLLALASFLSVLLVLYAYRQRSQTLKQEQELLNLELEQERQYSQISNLTAMLEGQENERARLARDLHDGLGGILSGTKISLSTAIGKKDTQLESKVNKSIGQLDIAVNELRRVAHNLMPELLLKYGLQAALEEYACRMSNDSIEISTQFVNFETDLDSERQILVYRIIQELVNNAVKHAEADQILIQFVENEGRIQITVEDNGKGFDIHILEGKKTAGMHNIASRLDFLQGKMHIDSKKKLGTTIELDFPSKLLAI